MIENNYLMKLAFELERINSSGEYDTTLLFILNLPYELLEVR